jgi:glycosyltransferase involved in cell wall biosynthesis
MINPPTISIVTPSFNQGQFLEECIDSVLGQNYPGLQYVIMDGGSTDNSPAIIKKYEKYLTYWQSGPDGGQYAAINEGFRRTSGDIMAWLNSDDKYHHNAFYKVAYAFTSNPGAEWLTGRPSDWDSAGDLSRVAKGPLPLYSREKHLRKEYNDPSIQQESTFWKRSLWEKAGGSIRGNLAYAGDLELWMRFFRHARLHTVDALLAGYRRHGNQKAALFAGRYAAEAETVLDEEMALLRKGVYPDLPPAPPVLSLPYADVKSFTDSVYEASRPTVYKLSDDSDRVIAFVLKELERYAAGSDRETVVKEALVVLLRKLHAYKFYLRHEPSFGRVYRFFRKIFVSEKKCGPPGGKS